MTQIELTEVRQNNLTGFDLRLQHHALTCVTGVSGSGKSSLVFDTLLREAQRRYLESFSSAARHTLGKLGSPDLRSATGLMPAIAVDQKTVVRNPRSTVGTLSELYDFLRLLMARFGESDAGDDGTRPSRSSFSFNSPLGWCPACRGLGLCDRIDPELLVDDPTRSLRQRALKITQPNGYTMYSQVTIDVLDEVCRSEGFTVDTPWGELSEAEKKVVLWGSDKIRIPYGKHPLESRMRWTGIKAKPREEGTYRGIMPVMEGILRAKRNPGILRFARTEPCESCGGARLDAGALRFRVAGKTIAEIAALSIADLPGSLSPPPATAATSVAWETVVSQIGARCRTVGELGLDYLTLDRPSSSLSAGEAQGLRLATQIGTGLRGVLYVLDEPTVGLHPRDTQRLIGLMKRLRDLGNTVVVVEHDLEVMRHADELIEIGPAAGRHGGELLVQGPVAKLVTEDSPGSARSPTLEALRSPRPEAASRPERAEDRWLRLDGIRHRNLAGADARFLLGGLNLVTGVAGAGKSTLVIDTLAPMVAGTLAKGVVLESSGLEELEDAVVIDQAPIGRNPRSNPATYTKLLDPIRALFASQPEAVARGWDPGRFSFNVEGGRCEACEGAGVQETGLHFLGSVQTTCERCHGRRFDAETLAVTWRGKSIFDVLALEVAQARELFADQPRVARLLAALDDLGLGYLPLGQPATTLSGGEAQRIKLATALGRAARRATLFILDEPTTGLHERDVAVLLDALRALVVRGHTLVLVDNHDRLLRAADHVIDLGPGSGEEGGRIVYQGDPAGLQACEAGVTGEALRQANAPLPPPPSAAVENHTASIRLRGIATHNLADFDLDLPRGRLIAITGVSGSGKSALAVDTLLAEGQRRFLESFSTHARQLLGQAALPEVREASGLTPSIGIDQRSVTRHPRSTVGTVTRAYDLWRLLFARLGRGPDGERVSLLSSHFSFNHEVGACPGCDGLGRMPTCDPDRLISHPDLPLVAGATKGSKTGRFFGDPDGQHVATLRCVGERHGIDFTQSWQALPERGKEIALTGTGEESYDVQWRYQRKGRKGEHRFSGAWPGLIALVNDEFRRLHEQARGADVRGLMHDVACELCGGARLNAERRKVTVAGESIAAIAAERVDHTLARLDTFGERLPAKERPVWDRIAALLRLRLGAMCDLGLGYLALDRGTITLSGGEGRRLRLAAGIGAQLCGVTYVVDEPTVGLHPRDTERLVGVLEALRDQGNTVVVVEHDPQVVDAADHLIELGPGAGDAGGRLLYAGPVTGRPSGKVDVAPTVPRNGSGAEILIRGARARNLDNLDLCLPLDGLTVLTGVSGAGKSSLALEVIAASAARGAARGCDAISGLEVFGAIHAMDQRPLGSSPQSTPASVTGVLDDLRSAFAKLETAKVSGHKKPHFSYNNKQARCPTCEGLGQQRIAMDFLADVWTRCADCHGHRYGPEILQHRLSGHTIADFLEIPVATLRRQVGDQTQLAAKLATFEEIGLGHLRLGQGVSTLSGGEAQRLRLVRALLQPRSGSSLFILDEPTAGLHERDVGALLALFARLCADGHALLVCEHHPMVIAAGHHVVELGPGGGDDGGRLVEEAP